MRIVLKILVGAVLVFVVAGGALLYDLFLTQEVEQTEELSTEQIYLDEFLSTLNQQESLDGSIYITTIKKQPGRSLPVDDTGMLLPLSFYTYDVEKEVISPSDSPYMMWYPQSSADNKLLFVTQPFGWEAYEPSVFIQTNNETPQRQITNEFGSSTQQRIAERRLPRWSFDSSKYAYSAQVRSDEGEVPVDQIDSWKVFVGEPGTEGSEYFADGYGAQWLASDDSLVYVKDDGIYAKRYIQGEDHLQTQEFRIIEEEHKINNHIGVSPDGKYIAVVYPLDPQFGNSFVNIYKIENRGEEILAVQMLRIDLESQLYPVWPVFSPGGRYLSIQTYDHMSQYDNNHISIFDFVASEFVSDVNFSDFYFNYAFNTDWVADRTQ